MRLTNEEINELIEYLSAKKIKLKSQENEISLKISELKNRLEKENPSLMVQLYHAQNRATEEKYKAIRMRLRLLKALKLLHYKWNDIAEICGISVCYAKSLYYSLDHQEGRFGPWLKDVD